MSFAPQFEEMKRFVRFGVRDEELLRELCAHARPSFVSIAREFYERNREHEEAHAVFENEAQIERLHHSLIGWLERVLSGPYDEAYCDKSLEIGRAHVRVGLPQRFMFTAMALFRMRLQDIVVQRMAERAGAACQALARVLDIELGLMNETYLEAALARARRIEDEQRRVSLRGMEQAAQRYAVAVELAGAILVGLDPQGRIQIFNREAQRVTGYAREEVLGASFAELLVIDRQPFDAAWARAQHGGGTVELELALRTRTHRVREIAAELSLGGDEGASSTLHILAGQDVTHERAIAAQLRQSERLAAVGTLAAGLAHEIRNPLNGAQLHLTYLKRAIDRQRIEGDLKETVDVVAVEVKRLSRLVSDFLGFARPGELIRSPTNIQALARHSLSMVCGGDSIELLSQLPDSDIVAHVDGARIEQVVLNLLTNAVEAARHGSGSKVILRLLREPRCFVIEVEDDGPGLPSSDAPIFDAFYSTKAGGTGMGLAIVHRIVTDHDGDIEVQSAPGRTVFRVRLPLQASDAPMSIPPSVQPLVAVAIETES